METNLRVLIADEDERALEGLRGTLEGLGHEVVPFAVSVREAAELTARISDLEGAVTGSRRDRLLEALEEAIDAFEKVANIVEQIAVKES